MAVALVVAEDRPVKDSWGRWYRGMVCVVKPDDWRWGRKEGPPKFRLIRFPRLTVEEVEELFMQMDDEVLYPGTDQEIRRFHGRRNATIPEARLQAADARPDGTFTINRNKAAVEAMERTVFERDPTTRPPGGTRPTGDRLVRVAQRRARGD